jgi:hypothetical protein
MGRRDRVGKFGNFGSAVADTFKGRREHISERAGGLRRGDARFFMARVHGSVGFVLATDAADAFKHALTE